MEQFGLPSVGFKNLNFNLFQTFGHIKIFRLIQIYNKLVCYNSYLSSNKDQNISIHTIGYHPGFYSFLRDKYEGNGSYSKIG